MADYQMRDLVYDWNTHAGRPDPNHAVTFDDETLRDGLQSPSITDPTVEQKLAILHLMDKIGIHTADLGLPGAGPRAREHVRHLAREIARQRLCIGANCAARTVIADIQPIADITQETGVPITAAVFLGSSPIRQLVEDWDLEHMKRLTREAVGFCVKHGLDCMYVTEDTTRAHPDTIRALYTTAVECGAGRVVVCDTVGHATPEGAYAVVGYIKEIVRKIRPEVKIDWHGHRDRGLSIPNSIAAIMAGADQVHGCALGIGERVGNTPMDLLLVNLHLMGLLGKEIQLGHLPEYVDAVSRATGIPVPPSYPVFGKDAFLTGTGVHAAAVIKALKKGDHWLANRIYSGVPAEEFGLEQKIAVGPMSGKSNVVHWLECHGIAATEDKVNKVFEAAKHTNRLLTDDEIRSLLSPDVF